MIKTNQTRVKFFIYLKATIAKFLGETRGSKRGRQNESGWSFSRRNAIRSWMMTDSMRGAMSRRRQWTDIMPVACSWSRVVIGLQVAQGSCKRNISILAIHRNFRVNHISSILKHFHKDIVKNRKLMI